MSEASQRGTLFVEDAEVLGQDSLRRRPVPDAPRVPGVRPTCQARTVYPPHLRPGPAAAPAHLPDARRPPGRLDRDPLQGGGGGHPAPGPAPPRGCRQLHRAHRQALPASCRTAPAPAHRRWRGHAAHDLPGRCPAPGGGLQTPGHPRLRGALSLLGPALPVSGPRAAGGRHRRHAPARRLGYPSRLASLQGYAGCFQGYVTDLARAWLQALDASALAEVEVFACGPHPMLAAVAALAREFALPCQVSLEEYMACGVGGCAGCTVEVRTTAGPAMKRVCVDGPVFEAQEVFSG